MKLTYNGKVAISLLVVALLTVGFCFWVSAYLHGNTARLLAEIDVMEVAIEAEDWTVAGEEYAKIYENWQSQKNLWQGLLHHDEIANIDSSFLMLKGAIEGEIKENILGQVYILEYYLQVPALAEELTWYNLF